MLISFFTPEVKKDISFPKGSFYPFFYKKAEFEYLSICSVYGLTGMVFVFDDYYLGISQSFFGKTYPIRFRFHFSSIIFSKDDLLFLENGYKPIYRLFDLKYISNHNGKPDEALKKYVLTCCKHEKYYARQYEILIKSVAFKLEKYQNSFKDRTLQNVFDYLYQNFVINKRKTIYGPINKKILSVQNDLSKHETEQMKKIFAIIYQDVIM